MEYLYRIPLDLQFFGSEDEGKTEKATPKKREDVRKKGQVAKSNELNTSILLLSFFGAMNVLGSKYLNKSTETVEEAIKLIPDIINNYNNKTIVDLIGDYIFKVVSLNGFIWAILFVVSFIVCIVQVGWHPTSESIKPKFSKMNPLKGLKKIISKDSLVELVKSIFKLIVLGIICINTVSKEFNTFIRIYDMTPINMMLNICSLISKIGFNVGGAFLFIAVLDYGYQKFKFEDSIKMSKQDIKDEYKQSDGDPMIKGKIRQKQREMSMKRMMQAIPEADVIITNPTHFAVAIKYDESSGMAPIVVAKGMDHLAQKIKEKARENKIEIVENKILARTLYSTVDIGKQIPPELYSAVAEVLAFVYSLKNK